MPSHDDSKFLNWAGYIYGGLAHSAHLQFDTSSEEKGEVSVRRGLERMSIVPEAVNGWHVMDVGTGIYSLGFHRLGAIVEHRDISLPTVRALSRYSQEKGYTRIKSIHTDLTSDALPEAHFDLIYLSGVYQHFARPAVALVNLSKALKVGGYLYIDIYRSGRWRWFVVDVLRKIVDRALLHDVLGRFTEFCALGDQSSFQLRQVELLVDDVFVDHVNLIHPADLRADCQEIGLQAIMPTTSMNLLDSEVAVDHSLFFAHVFSTMVFRKGTFGSLSNIPRRTMHGRDQLSELAGMSGTYSAVLDLTAEFILAHKAGRYPRDHVVSHIVNLFRMAHPCLPMDPYLVPGNSEPSGSKSISGCGQTLNRRHALWSSFLANVLGVPNPVTSYKLDSLGYELARFI